MFLYFNINKLSFIRLDIVFEIYFQIKTAIDKSFGIRCPSSVNVENSDVLKVYDFEDCRYDNRPVNDTAFCGKVI